MLRFEGPVVAQNQILFASDWMQATGEVLGGLAQNFTPKAGGFPAQVMGDGPTERRGATPQLFAHAIARAQRQLTISTPYFSCPTPRCSRPSAPPPCAALGSR